jgi:jacalin-like lectin domain-containing protein
MVILNSRLFGGEGGTPFNEAVSHISRIERIVVHYAQYVHGLEVTYQLDNEERLSKSYGRPGGENSPEIVLADDERICAIGVRSGQYVDSLTFVTYRMFNLVGMKQYGPYGGPGGQGGTVLSPNIREFFGRAGAILDAVGFRGEEPMLFF